MALRLKGEFRVAGRDMKRQGFDYHRGHGGHRGRTHSFGASRVSNTTIRPSAHSYLALSNLLSLFPSVLSSYLPISLPRVLLLLFRARRSPKIRWITSKNFGVLLLRREREQLGELEDRLDDKERRVREVSGVLPQAIKLSRERGGGAELTRALQPSVESSIRTSLEQNGRRCSSRRCTRSSARSCGVRSPKACAD